MGRRPGRGVKGVFPEPIVVVGGGGHGRETVALIREIEAANPGRWQLLGVVADDEPPAQLLAALGLRLARPHRRAREHRVRASPWLWETACSYPPAGAGRRVGQPCSHPGPPRRFGRARTSSWGTAATSAPFRLPPTHVRLGEGVQVNVGCSISHDVTIGSFATLAPGVRLAGGVMIEDLAPRSTPAQQSYPAFASDRGAVVGAGAVDHVRRPGRIDRCRCSGTNFVVVLALARVSRGIQ